MQIVEAARWFHCPDGWSLGSVDASGAEAVPVESADESVAFDVTFTSENAGILVKWGGNPFDLRGGS